MPNPRTLNLLIFLAALSLIGVALFMQHAMDLEPCYLCIVQRVFVVLTGSIALLAFIHNPGKLGTRIYAAITALSAISGGAFSIRQLWLQSLPEDLVPACGPPADYLFDALPLMDVVPLLLRGDGNCAEIQWTLLGISIPGYTLMAFSGLVLLGLWQLFRKH
ncbi:MAG: disulfide bond formation protein B [Porticoccaceae bacterium]|nr:disulfide bond formation protein B [Porticoccaceae bacterium]